MEKGRVTPNGCLMTLEMNVEYERSVLERIPIQSSYNLAEV
jgi:hypothetical protein